MGKKEQNETRDIARQNAAKAEAEKNKSLYGGGAFGAKGLTGNYEAAKANQQKTRGEIEGWQNQAKEFTESGGYDPGQLQKVREGFEGVSKTGSIDPAEMERVKGGYADLSKSGSLDPAAMAKVSEGYGNLATHGSLNPEETAKIRAGYGQIANSEVDPEYLKHIARIRSGYEGFADTGGFSDAERASFKRGATAGVPAAYNVLMGEARRKRAATGGLGGGGEISQMARQLGETSARANTAAENDLASQIRAGKELGLGGLQTTNENYLGATDKNVQNRLSGLGGLSDVERGVTEGASIGLAGQKGVEEFKTKTAEEALKGSADLNQQATTSSINATKGLSEQESQLALNRISSMKSGGELAQAAFNTETGEVTDIGNQVLKVLGLASDDQRANLKTLQDLSNTPGVFDNIIRFGTMAAGAAGAVSGTSLGAKIGLGKP